MYQYENGVKRKNVGYARIEAKNGQCKITLHMQLLGQLDSIFPTYLIQRDEKGLELVYLGDTVLKNQVMDSKLTANEANIMDSGYGLSQMGGLLLFLNDSVFFATEWDDKPIVAKEVLEALKPKKKNNQDKEKQNVGSIVTVDLQSVQEKPKYNIPKYETTKASSEPQYIVPQPETVQLSLSEELQIPKYKLPRGWKTLERLQKPTVTPIDKPESISLEAANLHMGVDPNYEKEQPSTYEQQTEVMEEKQTEAMEEQHIDIIEDQQNTVEKHLEYLSSMSDHLQEISYLQQELKEIQEELLNEERMHLESESLEFEQKEASMEESGVQQDLEEEEGDHTVNSQEYTEEEENATAKPFFDNYPRIYPFEDNEIILCVKIEPKDIGMLPKEIWPYSNNSFLMHGFYCYHHLIFAKMKDRNGCRYILGIPGIYHNRERFMAKMFGFENFKSIRRRELRQGDFGYWYLPINF